MDETREAGRHEASGQPPFRIPDGAGFEVRLAIIAIGVVVGLAAAGWRWVVNTALLGARLPTAVHAVLVAVFLIVALVVVVAAVRHGYRALARWSQARRSKQRSERL